MNSSVSAASQNVVTVPDVQGGVFGLQSTQSNSAQPAAPVVDDKSAYDTIVQSNALLTQQERARSDETLRQQNQFMPDLRRVAQDAPLLQVQPGETQAERMKTYFAVILATIMVVAGSGAVAIAVNQHRKDVRRKRLAAATPDTEPAQPTVKKPVRVKLHTNATAKLERANIVPIDVNTHDAVPSVPVYVDEPDIVPVHVHEPDAALTHIDGPNMFPVNIHELDAPEELGTDIASDKSNREKPRMPKAKSTVHFSDDLKGSSRIGNAKSGFTVRRRASHSDISKRHCDSPNVNHGLGSVEGFSDSEDELDSNLDKLRAEKPSSSVLALRLVHV